MINNLKQFDTLKYQGKVTCTIKSGSKVIRTNIFHNKGGIRLSEFIANCIAGNYSTAENMRPFKIKLVNNSGSLSEAITNPIVNLTGNYSSSNFVTIDSTPKVDPIQDQSKTIGYKATLHFTVPFSYISKEFNQFLLFGKNNSDTTENELQDYIASFLLTTTGEESTKDDNEWAPVDAETVQNNRAYNLYVEWTLAILDQSETGGTN